MPETISVQDLIRREAEAANIDPAIALAIADQESSFNPTAIGQPIKGRTERAIGTFQLLPSTAKSLGVNPADPLQNIQGGVKYIRQLLDQYGDPAKALNAYGGVDKSNLPYAQEVMAKMARYKTEAGAPQAASVAPAPTPVAGRGTATQNVGTTAKQNLFDFGAAYNPATPTGRENLVSTAAGVGVSAVAPEAGLVPWLVKALTPSVAGAVTAGAEQYLGTAPPVPGGAAEAATDAAKRQAMYEIGGRMFLWPIRKLARVALARPVSEAAAAGIEQETKAATAASEAAYQTERAKSPSVETTSKAVSGVTRGPAAAARRATGQTVAEAAATGPEIQFAPVKQELATMTRMAKPESIYPSSPTGGATTGTAGFLQQQVARVQQAAATAATPAEKARFSKFLNTQIALPVEDRLPLSGILHQMSKAPDTISFADAHALKQLLDERVNWDRPAKAINERLTKGIRGVLREQMAVHPPYEAATAAYEHIAPLYDPRRTGGKIIKAARMDPDKLVGTLNEKRPIGAKEAKRLLVDQAAAGGDPAAGQRAWDAVRSQFTYRRLLTGGVKGLDDRVQTLVTENPEFAQTVYGDPTGQQVLSNLTRIGQAFTLAEAKGAQTMERFQASSLAGSDRHISHQAVDVAHGLIAPHSPGGMRSIARTLLGSPKAADFLEWASYSPLHTKLLINTLLHPEASEAGAMLVRAWNAEGRYNENDDLTQQPAPLPSH